MRTLTQYTKEEKDIREGFLGDLILRFVDTGLSWIGKGLDLLGQQISTSVSSSWDIIKQQAAKGNEGAKQTLKDGEKSWVKKVQGSITSKSFEQRDKAIGALMSEYSANMGIDKKDPAYVSMLGRLLYNNLKVTEASVNNGKEDKSALVKATKAVTDYSNKMGTVAKQTIEELKQEQAKADEEVAKAAEKKKSEESSQSGSDIVK